jgi:hypothetical protein
MTHPSIRFNLYDREVTETHIIERIYFYGYWTPLVWVIKKEDTF